MTRSSDDLNILTNIVVPVLSGNFPDIAIELFNYVLWRQSLLLRLWGSVRGSYLEMSKIYNFHDCTSDYDKFSTLYEKTIFVISSYIIS